MNDSVPEQPTNERSEIPIWSLLGADLHMHTLRPDYAPVGLLQMIPSAPRRILDVGCFCGGTGRWLKTKFPGVEVIGIECLSPAAAQAREIYDRVIEARIEEVDFGAQELLPGSMDGVVTADILEHLVNPWQVLQRLRSLVAPGGALYVSLPNVRNLNILMGLARGEWRYTGAGILDVTHLRFFTRAQGLEMLAETGWRVEDVRVNPDPRLQSFFSGRNPADIRSIEAGNITLKNLSQLDVLELMVTQFYIRAVPVRP